MTDGSVKDSMQPILYPRQRKYASDQEAKEANRAKNREHYWKNRDAIRKRQNEKYREAKENNEKYKQIMLQGFVVNGTTQNSATLPASQPPEVPPPPVTLISPDRNLVGAPANGIPQNIQQPIGPTLHNNTTQSLIQPPNSLIQTPNLNYDPNNQPFNAINNQPAVLTLPNGTQYPVIVSPANKYTTAVPNGNQYATAVANGNQYSAAVANGNQYNTAVPNGNQYNSDVSNINPGNVSNCSQCNAMPSNNNPAIGPNGNQYNAMPQTINSSIVPNGNHYPATPFNNNQYNAFVPNGNPLVFDRKY